MEVTPWQIQASIVKEMVGSPWKEKMASQPPAGVREESVRSNVLLEKVMGQVGWRHAPE